MWRFGEAGLFPAGVAGAALDFRGVVSQVDPRERGASFHGVAFSFWAGALRFQLPGCGSPVVGFQVRPSVPIVEFAERDDSNRGIVEYLVLLFRQRTENCEVIRGAESCWGPFFEFAERNDPVRGLAEYLVLLFR